MQGFGESPSNPLQLNEGAVSTIQLHIGDKALEMIKGVHVGLPSEPLRIPRQRLQQFDERVPREKSWAGRLFGRDRRDRPSRDL